MFEKNSGVWLNDFSAGNPTMKKENIPDFSGP